MNNNIGEIELEKIMKDVVSESNSDEFMVDVSYSSPNLMSRLGSKIDSIVVHTTFTNRMKDALRIVMNPDSGISTHFIICRDGRIMQLVSEDHASMHFGNLSNLMSSTIRSSIGIHMVSSSMEFTNNQYRSCAWLCARLVSKHGIDLMDIVDTQYILSKYGAKHELSWSVPRQADMDWKKFHSLCSMNLMEHEIETSIEDNEGIDSMGEGDVVDIYSPQPAYMMALALPKEKMTFWQWLLSKLGLK